METTEKRLKRRGILAVAGAVVTGIVAKQTVQRVDAADGAISSSAAVAMPAPPSL